MIFGIKNPFAERQRQAVFEPIGLVFLGIIFDPHVAIYVIHIVSATSFR